MLEYSSPDKSWVKYKEIKIDLTVNEFFDEFFSDNAAFGFEKMVTVVSKCWDLNTAPW